MFFSIFNSFANFFKFSNSGPSPTKISFIFLFSFIKFWVLFINLSKLFSVAIRSTEPIIKSFLLSLYFFLNFSSSILDLKFNLNFSVSIPVGITLTSFLIWYLLINNSFILSVGTISSSHFFSQKYFVNFSTTFLPKLLKWLCVT